MVGNPEAISGGLHYQRQIGLESRMSSLA